MFNFKSHTNLSSKNVTYVIPLDSPWEYYGSSLQSSHKNVGQNSYFTWNLKNVLFLLVKRWLHNSSKIPVYITSGTIQWVNKCKSTKNTIKKQFGIYWWGEPTLNPYFWPCRYTGMSPLLIGLIITLHSYFVYPVNRGSFQNCYVQYWINIYFHWGEGSRGSFI